jgi:hypothetical protein
MARGVVQGTPSHATVRATVGALRIPLSLDARTTFWTQVREFCNRAAEGREKSPNGRQGALQRLQAYHRLCFLARFRSIAGHPFFEEKGHGCRIR